MRGKSENRCLKKLLEPHWCTRNLLGERDLSGAELSELDLVQNAIDSGKEVICWCMSLRMGEKGSQELKTSSCFYLTRQAGNLGPCNTNAIDTSE
jgi:hypothetical protein